MLDAAYDCFAAQGFQDATGKDAGALASLFGGGFGAGLDEEGKEDKEGVPADCARDAPSVKEAAWGAACQPRHVDSSAAGASAVVVNAGTSLEQDWPGLN